MTINYRKEGDRSVTWMSPQVKFEFHLFERELCARTHGCARAFPFLKVFGGFIRKWNRLWKVLLFFNFIFLRETELCFKEFLVILWNDSWLFFCSRTILLCNRDYFFVSELRIRWVGFLFNKTFMLQLLPLCCILCKIHKLCENFCTWKILISFNLY